MFKAKMLMLVLLVGIVTDAEGRFRLEVSGGNTISSQVGTTFIVIIQGRHEDRTSYMDFDFRYDAEKIRLLGVEDVGQFTHHEQPDNSINGGSVKLLRPDLVYLDRNVAYCRIKFEIIGDVSDIGFLKLELSRVLTSTSAIFGDWDTNIFFSESMVSDPMPSFVERVEVLESQIRVLTRLVEGLQQGSTAPGLRSDINGDGVVNIADFLIFVEDFGKGG